MTNNTYHYVYRITHINNRKHYYGVRSSKIEPRFDLGYKYFSSSTDKDFINEQKTNKQNFKYKIVAIFNTRELAANREIILHRRFNVAASENFYNRAIHTTSGFDVSGYKFGPPSIETRNKIRIANTGKICQEETKEKLRAANLGKPCQENAKIKISESLTGRPRSEETKAKISESHKNKIVSDETRAKMSSIKLGIPRGSPSEETIQRMRDSAKNRENQNVTCPHCGKVASRNSMNRWHFNNCKYLLLDQSTEEPSFLAAENS